MIAFIGLGNPGAKYELTKHNAGYWVVDELARRWKIKFKAGKGDFVYAEKKHKKLLLAKPTSGMNVSGLAVKSIVNEWQIDIENLFVIVDDVDLPLGAMRIRPKGGDGCHRGMESVIYHLENDQFPRLRFGIQTSEQTRPAEKFVLKPFRNQDLPDAREMVIRMAEAVETILYEGLNKAMNKFN